MSIAVTTTGHDARFLAACLESISQQTHRNLDVVIVCWGSSDAVRTIARQWSQRDVRMSVLTANPADVAGARSAGAAAARGEFLQFVLGEDTLPPRAVESLVASLQRSGSDLAIGRRKQVVQLGRRVREAKDPLHQQARHRATTVTCPAVVSDLGLENRLFRTSFWRGGAAHWQARSASTVELVLRATIAATTFDVVTHVVYRDMNRSVGVPVGALEDPLAELDEWIGSQRATLAAVSRADNAEVINYWATAVLDGELQVFLDRCETATEEQWATLREHADALTALAPEAIDRVRAESRVKLRLLERDDRARLEEFLASRWFARGNKPTEAVGDQVYAAFVGFRDPEWGLPDDTFAMTPDETSLEVVLRSLRWVEPTTLALTFFVWIDFLAYADPGELTLDLVDEVGGRRPLDFTRTRDNAVNHFAEHRDQDYSWGRVDVPIDVADLFSTADAEQTWRLEFALKVGDVRRVGGVSRRDERGSAGPWSWHAIAPRAFDTGTVSVRVGGGLGFELVTGPPPSVQLSSATITGRRLAGRLVASGLTVNGVRAVGSHGPQIRGTLNRDSDSYSFELSVPVSPARAGRPTWTLEVTTSDQTTHRVAWPPTAEADWIDGGEVALTRSAAGLCEIREATATLVITEFSLIDDPTMALRIKGWWLGPEAPGAQLLLTSGRVTLTGDLREASQGAEAVIDLEVDPWGRGAAPVPADRYVLSLQCAGDSGVIEMSSDLIADLLRFRDARAWSWRPYRTAGEIGVLLNRPLDLAERGPYYQHQLQLQRAAATTPLDDRAVYLQSYNGASATDSQLAIHQELRRRHPDWTLYWGVFDRSSWVPEGAHPVVLNSREWYAAVTTCRYLANNIDFDRWFTPRPGQKFLQTFHGYPAKSMGIRLWRAKSFTPRRIDAELARTSQQWDLILTPTPEMDQHYRNEYNYTGEILSAGYPRDDALVGPAAAAIRQRTRELLGISAGQTAVLYAPTWRDDLATNYRNAEMAQHIDLEDASAALGPEFVFLMRGHRFHGKAGSRQGSARLIDVTHYPEINDLILASDAAVLDYSSLRFDFALTRRPMVFLVPDLADYTGSVRGFLYDFAPSAPGPLLDTPEQVVAALRNLPGVARDYADAYERFHQTYNYLQDGHSAARVVDQFFE